MAFGAAPALLRSMMADLIDEDALRTGKQRAGLFFALLTTTNKLGSAIAVGIVLALVEGLFGFAPGAENTQSAIDGLFITYCAAPFIALGIAYLPLIRYPLGRHRHSLSCTAMSPSGVRTVPLQAPNWAKRVASITRRAPCQRVWRPS